MKADISCLKKALVGAEYLPPALRAAMRGRGIQVCRCTARGPGIDRLRNALRPDGSVNDGMILEEGLILEIVRPAPAIWSRRAKWAKW
jgi:phenylacetate-CoA ligase